jgi:hypothetical protein
VGSRRIALFITLTMLTLVTLATPAASAAAEAPSLPELRAQLRQTRHHLVRALGRLGLARDYLAKVQAVVTAGGGAPFVLPAADIGGTATEPVASADGATVTASPDPAATTGALAVTADAAATVVVDDPGLAALIAALDPSLAAQVLGDGTIGADEVAGLQERVAKWRGIVRDVRRAARRLEARIAVRRQIAAWDRRGAWRPLIEIAARRYHVNAGGLYRMMMYESGGNRFAGSTFKGLFQYYPATWRAGWNPWRAQSITDGWAQIQATAYAIHRGMGPAAWPVTYSRAF